MANFKRSKPNPRGGGPDPPIQYLRLIVEARLISRFLQLTERGFRLKIAASLSIRELLCKHLGISEDYVDNRIQTIFLDGRPVDDVDTASIQNGSKLALSAAMPGLVGITLRKGGFYASLRSTISYSKTEASIVKDEGEIILKFFNLVAKELGPAFLQKGILIEGKRFQDFALRNADDLKADCNSMHLNDTEIDVDRLKEMTWEDQEVFLQVAAEK